MNSVVLTKIYNDLPFCEKEILRYAGCVNADDKTKLLLSQCLDEARDKLSYKVCYSALKLEADLNICDFDVFRLESEKLARNLKGCNQVILFAATVGVGIDRLITKYSRLSPAKALFFQAIGAERIEALCDAFCADISQDYNVQLKPRFSPGYADLPLESQREIFRFLDPERKIGLTLNDSMLMSPTKSVTAFVGITQRCSNDF